MALFDFLKKREIEEIKKFKNDIERVKDAYQTEIANLNIQLVRYRTTSIFKRNKKAKNELPSNVGDKTNSIADKEFE